MKEGIIMVNLLECKKNTSILGNCPNPTWISLEKSLADRSTCTNFSILYTSSGKDPTNTFWDKFRLRIWVQFSSPDWKSLPKSFMYKFKCLRLLNWQIPEWIFPVIFKFWRSKPPLNVVMWGFLNHYCMLLQRGFKTTLVCCYWKLPFYVFMRGFKNPFVGFEEGVSKPPLCL